VLRKAQAPIPPRDRVHNTIEINAGSLSVQLQLRSTDSDPGRSGELEGPAVEDSERKGAGGGDLGSHLNELVNINPIKSDIMAIERNIIGHIEKKLRTCHM
jgi:hypothetical protein